MKSTLIMRENLEELNGRGLSEIPVLLGGAALTRTYVERDLRQIYEGRVFYGRDAFEGLRTMDRLIEIKRGEPRTRRSGARSPSASVPRRSRLDSSDRPVEGQPARSPEVATDNRLFVAALRRHAGWPRASPSTTSPTT